MGSADKLRILIVDDEPANRRLLRACLGSEYELEDAEDGARALELFERTPFDLVLLDVMMPGVGGLEVCRRIKELATTYVPVILLTALGQQGDRNAGLEAGADDFLTKPVDGRELLLRVETFLKLRRQDQRIREQLGELSKRDELIQQQLTELRRLDATKDELVALMVHDLRNPLSGIMGFLSLLASGDQGPGVRDEADEALRASLRLREILEDILQVRMLESGTVRLYREVVQADKVVRDAIDSVRGAARARSVDISLSNPEPGVGIDADRKLVRRAVENLLSNAVKYSPDGGVVQTLVRQSGEEVEIEIADRGGGVPNELKQQLFQRFGSVEAAQGQARSGVGLGLYLVKLVATAHGGRASVRDRRHGGAAFGIFLPSLPH
jgi:signal transduction histidine kinase